MEWLIGLFFIGVVVLSIYAVYKNEKKKKVRVKCDSCGAAMSYGRWKENDGCTQCGSDLFSVDLEGRGRGQGITRL